MSKRKIAALLDEALLGSDGIDAAPSVSFTDPVLIRNTDSEFMRRLETFKISPSCFMWFNKDDSISAVECSLNGWTCVAVDTLQCLTCNVKLTGQVQPEQLRRGHALPKCAELRSGSTFTFPVCSVLDLVHATQHRVGKLLEIPESIPHVEKSHDLAQYLKTLTPTQPNPTLSTVTTTACLNLALYGWEPISTPTKTSLKCHLCTRLINLAKYSKTSAPQSTPISLRFHPREEHRWYCPWIYSASTNNHEPGWKQSLAAIEQVNEEIGENGAGKISSPVVLKRRVLQSPSESPVPQKLAGERDLSHVKAARDSLKELFRDLI